ncbi:MAG: peptidase domain-containing ABC transporter [Ktedonobacteraceae bacterium]|nr:peptidase domain-containing ABC transporter [Ktedonobacteraceae bacterium]
MKQGGHAPTQWLQQTSRKQSVVSPRFSLPSHSQEEANQQESSPELATPRSAILPALTIKAITMDSLRPVTSLKQAVIDPSRMFDSGKHTTSGPQLLALPTRRTASYPVPSVLPETPKESWDSWDSKDSWDSSVKSQSVNIPLRVLSPQEAAAKGKKPQQEEKQQQAEKQQKEISRPRRMRRQRRVPEMRQVTAVECGAACLAMVLNYYGYATSISEVQEQCGVGRDGLSAGAIAKAARRYGLRVRAVSIKHNDLRDVTLPAIVHWEFNHFVIVERWSQKYVSLVDPAVGRRRLTSEEFDEGFTGVVLMLEPGPQFEQRAPQQSFTLWGYALSLLRLRGIVAQVLGASLLLQILGLGAPLLTAILVDGIIPSGSMNLLLLLGLGMLLLLVAQGLTKFFRASLLIYLQTRIDMQMVFNFFGHLLDLPYRFFQMRMNGDLLARMSSNTAIRDLLTNQLLSTLLDSSTLIVALAVLIWQSWLVALVAILVGAIQVGLLLFTAPAVRRLTQRDLAAQGKAQGYLNEVLAGIATLKAAGAEQRAFDRWSNLYVDQMNNSVRRNYLLTVIGTIFEFLYGLSPLLLLWVGAMQVMAGNMSMGTMMALNTLAISFLTPLSTLATSGQKLQIAQAHFARIADVLEAEPEQDLQEVRTPPRLTGHIEVKQVSFQYASSTPLVLKNISLNIWPGQKVALVGKTGSGKSTLGKLLIGLVTPTKGSILFDGLPLQTLNYRDVRSQFGVVLQESFIFSGSVRENIALNDPAISMEAVVRAAQMAAIHEDIEKMPMGYETLVSEGGSAFSGGQRQRLALARALANRPAILLLDEATSALDVATERAVEQNLRHMKCTQIVIAHRLSTIRSADLILVLDQGQVVEMGHHDLLMRRSGYYARLIQAQIESGEIDAA